MAARPQTLVTGLPLLRQGKVRDVYDLGDSLLIVASDRISAFDVVMGNGIPDKGKVLTQMSNFWFRKFADVCPNHLLLTEDEQIRARLGSWTPDLAGRSVVVRKAEPLPIECVARGYITGSLYKEYQAFGPNVHGLRLPEGLLDGSRLDDAIFTPATKAQSGHDQNLSFEEACQLAGADTMRRVRDWTLNIYVRAAGYALERGIILADTKFEFGWFEGELIWIDEALTPDSSRFWDRSAWQPGGAQPSFDKQYVRDYLESIGWDKSPPGPTLPPEVVEGTRKRYLEAFQRLTGMTLAA
jgi:phosphoribosylaminoimidazole-succinocarboxamide synthase